MSKQEELQALYKSPLTTGGIKSEAWKIKGVSGNHFRHIVKGFGTNGKPFSEEDIKSCLKALKQAYLNDIKRRSDFVEKLNVAV